MWLRALRPAIRAACTANGRQSAASTHYPRTSLSAAWLSTTTDAAESALNDKFKAKELPKVASGDSLKLVKGKSLFNDGSKTWRLNVALLIERVPSLAPTPADWEVEKMEKDIEARNRIAKVYPQGVFREAVEAKDDDDDAGEGVRIFEAASNITAADESNDRKSLDRALAKRLYLIVKGKRGDGREGWHFPETSWREGETMRESAERLALENCGAMQIKVADRLREEKQRRLAMEADKIEVKEEMVSPEEKERRKLYETAKMLSFMVGNAPVGVIEGTYPSSVDGADGARTFFYRARRVEGDVLINEKAYNDHLWVTREELKEYIDSGDMEYVENILWNP